MAVSLVLPSEIYELEGLVDKLNELAREFIGQTGCDNPVPYLRDMALIDTDELRSVGEDLWGTPTSTSASADALDGEATALQKTLFTSVQDVWKGTAYDSFEAYITQVEKAMHDEATTMALIGQALVDIADAFETTILELIAWGLSLYSLLLAVVGFVVGLVGVILDLTGAGAVIGIVLNAIGFAAAFLSLVMAGAAMIVTVLSSVLPRLSALSDADATFGTPQKSVTAQLPSPPGGREGWEPK